MDFIERLFHGSPDGGDGSTEAMAVAILVGFAIVRAWRSWRRARAGSRSEG